MTDVMQFAAVQTDEIYTERARKLIALIVQAKADPMAEVVELLKKADELRAGNVDQRLAALLLEIGVNAPDRTILFAQDKMADSIGASRSFVSTILNGWKRDGVVSSFGRKLKIDSVSRLQKIARG